MRLNLLSAFSIALFGAATFFALPTAASAQESSGSCCESACDSACESGCDSACDGGCDSACGVTGRRGGHSLRNLLARDCTTGNYWSLSGGWNALDDYTGVDFPTPTVREGSFNDGWAIGGSIGRRFNRAIRAEVEYTFRDNTSDQWSVNQVPVGDWNGHFNNFSVMTNVYHDFADHKVLGWTPYVGGGIGIAFLDGEFETATLTLDVDDDAFAFQLIAGGSKQLTDNVDAFVEYRFMETDDFDLSNVTPPVPVQFGEDPYESHSVFVGLRIYR